MWIIISISLPITELYWAPAIPIYTAIYMLVQWTWLQAFKLYNSRYCDVQFIVHRGCRGRRVSGEGDLEIREAPVNCSRNFHCIKWVLEKDFWKRGLRSICSEPPHPYLSEISSVTAYGTTKCNVSNAPHECFYIAICKPYNIFSGLYDGYRNGELYTHVVEWMKTK